MVAELSVGIPAVMPVAPKEWSWANVGLESVGGADIIREAPKA